jgi:hypothetical protein
MKALPFVDWAESVLMVCQLPTTVMSYPVPSRFVGFLIPLTKCELEIVGLTAASRSISCDKGPGM